MLVLRRKLYERVIITLPDGRRITLAPVEIDRGYVRLGFEADKDIGVDREEVLKAKIKTPEPPA